MLSKMRFSINCKNYGSSVSNELADEPVSNAVTNTTYAFFFIYVKIMTSLYNSGYTDTKIELTRGRYFK